MGGKRDVLRRSLAAAFSAPGLGWWETVRPNLYPGDAEQGALRNAGAVKRRGLQRKVMFQIKYCLEHPPPAPASPRGWMVPSPHSSIHPSIRPSLAVTGCSSCSIAFLNPHLYRKLSRPHRLPGSRMKLRFHCRAALVRAPQTRGTFLFSLFETLRSIHALFFLPACACLGGGLLPQVCCRQILAAAPFPAVWRAPGELPASVIE